MRKLLEITLLDLRIYLSAASNLVSLTVLPIVLTFVLGGVFSGGDGGQSRLRVDVIDQDQSEASAAFVADLQAVNPGLYLCPMEQSDSIPCELPEVDGDDVDAAVQAVQDGDSNALVVIPSGYAAALENLEPLSLPYYSQADALLGDAVANSVDAVLQQVNGAVIAARISVAYVDALETDLGGDLFADESMVDDLQQTVYTAAETRWQLPSATISYEQTKEGVVQQDGGPAGFSQSVPGTASMFVLFTAISGIVLLLEERRQQTLQRLAAMPLARWQIIGGKILSRFLLCMLQFGIVFGLGLVVGLDFGNDLLALLLVMAAFAVCCTSLALWLATVVRSEGQASAMSTFLGLTLAALGGAWWSLELPFIPQIMRTISLISPVTYAMNGFNQLLYYGGTLVDVLVPVGILLAVSAVFFFFGIRNFKYV
ncbi:MAG: hypothetical protein CL607_02990 [Anaerolineaceae bacterium]|nr:hypothetical protein [Anaerolineaceae bacterium]